MIRDPSTDPALLIAKGSQLPWNGYLYMLDTRTYPEEFPLYVTDDGQWVQYQSLCEACALPPNAWDTKPQAVNRGCVFSTMPASEWVVFRWSIFRSSRNKKAEAKLLRGQDAGMSYLVLSHDTLDNFFAGNMRGQYATRWETMKKWWASKPPFLRSVQEKDRYVAEFNRRHAEKYNLDLEKGVFKFV
jgi:hypothetical protein